jgi:hypothetical protein
VDPVVIEIDVVSVIGDHNAAEVGVGRRSPLNSNSNTNEADMISDAPSACRHNTVYWMGMIARAGSIDFWPE